MVKFRRKIMSTCVFIMLIMSMTSCTPPSEPPVQSVESEYTDQVLQAEPQDSLLEPETVSDAMTVRQQNLEQVLERYRQLDLFWSNYPIHSQENSISSRSHIILDVEHAYLKYYDEAQKMWLGVLCHIDGQILFTQETDGMLTPRHEVIKCEDDFLFIHNGIKVDETYIVDIAGTTIVDNIDRVIGTGDRLVATRRCILNPDNSWTGDYYTEYYDSVGNLVLGPYDGQGMPFRNGLAAIQINGRETVSYINLSGDIVIEDVGYIPDTGGDSFFDGSFTHLVWSKHFIPVFDRKERHASQLVDYQGNDISLWDISDETEDFELFITGSHVSDIDGVGTGLTIKLGESRQAQIEGDTRSFRWAVYQIHQGATGDFTIGVVLEEEEGTLYNFSIEPSDSLREAIGNGWIGNMYGFGPEW